MWDEIAVSTLVGLAAVAIAVAAGLAFLKKSKARTTLIFSWTSLPCLLVIAASVATVLDHGFDATAFFGFTAMFSLFLLPPWALLTLLPFNLVRRWREIGSGIRYGTGS